MAPNQLQPQGVLKKSGEKPAAFFFFFFFFCCFSKRLDMYEDLCVMAASAPDTEISFSA